MKRIIVKPQSEKEMTDKHIDFLKEFAKEEGITDENGCLKEPLPFEKKEFKWYKYYLIATFYCGNDKFKYSEYQFKHFSCLEDLPLLMRKTILERQLYDMISDTFGLREELDKYCVPGEGIHTHYHVFRIDDSHNKIFGVFGYHTFIEPAFAEIKI